MDKMESIKIPVYHKSGIVYAIVDADYDGEYIAQFKWYLSKTGYPFRHDNEYSLDVRTGEWRRVRVSLITMHSDIMGSKKGLEVDHIDRNKLNNRSCNLRHVTHKQNCHNRKVPVMTEAERKSKNVARAQTWYKKNKHRKSAYDKARRLALSALPSE